MRNGYRKGVAVLLILLMTMSVFAALPTAKAWNTPLVQTENSRGDNMVEITGLAASADPFYLGQQDRTVRPQLHNTGDVPVTLNRVMISVDSVRGPDGTVTTSAIHWDVDTDNGPGGTGYTITSGNTQWTIDFQFDIDQDIANAPPGTYNITFKMDYEYDDDNDGGAVTAEVADSELEYIEFDIGTNIGVSDAQPDLYAGQTFTPLNINVDDNVWNGAHNLYLNLSNIPTGITFDSTNGWIPGNVNNPSTVGFRVDVARDMAAGVYTVDYEVQYYNNDDVWCTDTGTLDITVEFTPVIEAEALGTTTITQGDASIPALEVRFINTGNVDLRNIEITPELDGIFFYSTVDFYEGAGGSGDQNTQMVDTIQIDSLAQGANTSDSWFIALNQYVQAGDHRILFDWTATYFDNGATNNPTQYVDVNGFWYDDDWDSSTPMVPGCSVYGGEWIAGPYVMVTVNDNTPDFTADKMENVDTWNEYFDIADDNLVYVDIGTDINNFEYVGFTDLRATLQVGEGTPFMNPLNHSATTVENDLWNSDDSVAADSSAWMEWFVDIDPNAEPGIYTVNITLTGRNADTGQEVHIVMQSVVEVRGFGPELIATSVTTGDINPGQQFTMNITITNEGDDTARDVFVFIPDSFIFGGDPSQYWNVVDGFVNSISTYRDDYQNGAETETIRDNANITLEQLNIKDAKDIVDLNLYIEGVFTHPAPTVWMVKASNLAPGESVDVTFHMISNANMAPGRPYVIPVEVGYIDSTGGNYFMDSSVTVQSTGVAEPYHATAGSQIVTSDNALGWGFLAVILILVLVLAWMFGPRRKEEESVYSEERPATWTEPTNTQAPAPPDEEAQTEGTIPEIAEMSADEPAAVDASGEVPLVYDEKENPPESF